MLIDDLTTLTQRFVDEWPSISDVPVFYVAQQAAERPTNAAYVHFSVVAGDTKHIGGSAQDGIQLSLGRVWLQVFIPPHGGDAEAITLMDGFASIFRHWRSADGAVFCKTERNDGPFPDTGSDMLIYTVSIPYESVRRY